MEKDLAGVLRQLYTAQQEIKDTYQGRKTVFMSDMKGSASLFEQLGDIEAATVVQRQRDTSLKAISSYNGQGEPVGGDGILAFFDSANDALKSAVKIQQLLQKENIGIRIGLNTGDVFLDTNMQCETINIASRIMSLADGGQILISSSTHQEAGEIDLAKFYSHGEYRLKGISEPIGVHEVLWYKDQQPKKPSQKVKKGIKTSPIKSTIVIGAILLLGLIAIKGIFQPQETGPTKKVEVSLLPLKISVEFYQPIDYYGGLPESPNLKVKEVFEKGRKYKQEYRFDEAIKEFKRYLELDPTDEEKGALYILIGNCAYSQSRYEEALIWYEKAIKITERIGDQAGLAATYSNIGLIHYVQGNYQEALKWYEMSIEITKKIGDKAMLATTYNNIGAIYDAQGNYQSALKWYEKSSKICEEIGDQAGLATTYNNIGSIHNTQGNYQRALVWYEKSIKIKEEIGDKKGLATTYDNIGSIYYAQGNYQEALALHERALKIREEIGDQAELATTYNNIGLIYDAQGNYQGALKWYEKSRKISEEIGDQKGLAATYNNIAGIYRAQGNYQGALKWLEKSSKICEEIGDQAVLATTYNNIGLIYDAQGNYQGALKWYEKSKEIVERIGNRHHLAISLRNIGILYRATGKKDKAKQTLKESYKIYLQLNLKSEAEEVKQLLDSP